jgi:hypothetical protein
MSTLTVRHLEIMFTQLLDCCLHDPPWTPGDVEQVLCSVWCGDESGGWKDCEPPEGTYYSWKDGTESSSYTVVRLRDGTLGLLAESEDYTGHGCQCSAAVSTYSSLADLQRFGVEGGEARDLIARRCMASMGTPELREREQQ